MKNLAIITARGGSKRIPRKNIRAFFGKPIISYSIEAALKAGIFQEIMVSTDDEEIAGLAKRSGASVPFMRSGNTSDDHATTAEVITEVLQEYSVRGQNFDFVCCLYPTAPFVTGEKIKTAYEMLRSEDADSVVPVTRYGFPIWRSLKMEGINIRYNWPEFASTRSQDLPPAYHDCGQFYFLRTESFLKTAALVTDKTIGMEIPSSEVQDIDNEEDWALAELKYRLAFITPGEKL